MPDRVRLARLHAERHRIVVACRQGIAQVALGAGARGPEGLRAVDRAGEESALLEVRDCAGVVAGAREWVAGLGWRARNVWRDVVVDERQAVGLPDVAEETVPLLVDVVAD